MRHWLIALVAASLCSSPAWAGNASGKVLLELWEVAYLGYAKAGYVHTLAKEFEKDGKKLIHTTVELRLTFKRNSDTVQMFWDTSSIETPDGKVLGISLHNVQGKGQVLHIDGTVVGKELHLLVNGKTQLKPAPWNPDVIGLYKQQLLFQDHKIKPGDRFTFLSFEQSINLVLKTEVVAKGFRDVELKGSKTKRKLLLVEAIPEKVEYQKVKVQLPALQLWLDDQYEPLKSEVEVPGMGPIVRYKTTKAQALAPAPLAQLTDIGVNQLVRMKNRILRPFETSGAVYRVTIRNDDDVASTFSRDRRQQVQNVRGNTFELHVKAIKAADGPGPEKEPPAEFLQSCYFINSDDAKVKELARQAVGAETDPWKKALRIEHWVKANMTFNYEEVFATADHVARTLAGDCTEYSMLTAAMCRAEGVPSRTAMGMVYTEDKGVPCFAFHMWTEVWVRGRWIGIDSTLGKGYVGATHLKVTDHSWYDERTMTPVFPVIRVMGRVSIDVLSAEN